jgi:hypothetical protein
MVAKKRKPAFSKFGIPRRFDHPTGDGSLRDVKPQHEEFTMDSRCAPGRIFCDHFKYQVLNYFRDSSPATTWAPDFGQATPVEFKSSSMPLNDGVRNHDEQSPFPIGPQPPSSDPKQSISKNLSRGFGFLRLNTASCCRRARFSRMRLRRARNSWVSVPKENQMMSSIFRF